MFEIKLHSNTTFAASAVDQQYRSDGLTSGRMSLLIEVNDPTQDLDWYRDALLAEDALDTVEVYADDMLCLSVAGYTQIDMLSLRIGQSGAQYVSILISQPSSPGGGENATDHEVLNALLGVEAGE